MLEYVTIHGPATTERWLLDGDRRDNTDNGRLFATIAGDTVTLYRDALREHAVAEGTVAGTEVALAPVNDSGLSGSFVLLKPGTATFALDVFYAADADLHERQAALESLLTDGEFAGASGFSLPRQRAKRTLDALLAARLPQGWFAEDLQPLTDAAACFALQFIYEHLATRADTAAAALAVHWQRRAREALYGIRLSIGADVIVPFTPRVTRA